MDSQTAASRRSLSLAMMLICSLLGLRIRKRTVILGFWVRA